MFGKKRKFRFSAEFAAAVIMFFVLSKIAGMSDYIGEHIRNDVFVIGGTVIAIAVVYGLGELVRRKFGLKSIIFDRSSGEDTREE